MSKVNVDEIKVGDLVEYTSPHFDHIRALGIATNIDGEQGVWGYWSDEDPNKEYRVSCVENITGHWKVINFEEEAKVDELKVYTGKETIEALLEGKVLQYGHPPMKLKLENKQALLDINSDGNWEESGITLQRLLELKFIEVATPQAGDWVRVTHTYSCGGEERTTIHTAQLTKVQGELMWAQWDNTGEPGYYRFTSEDITWQILTPEEVSEYKREQAFAKVGRKLNEFKANDIVYIEAVNRTAIVVSSNNETEIRLHSINVGEAGHTAKPHQLTPVCFVDHMVDLSEI